MDGRELPGFYFDPVKKKYFKIQPHHDAMGTGYSQSQVTDIKETERKRKRRDHQKQVFARHQIGRSRIAQSEPGRFLQRETRSNDYGILPIHSMLFASNIQQRVLFANNAPNMGTIAQLAWDPLTSAFFMACNYSDNIGMVSRAVRSGSLRPDAWDGRPFSDFQVIDNSESPSTSFTLSSDARMACQTTLGSPVRPSAIRLSFISDGPLPDFDRHIILRNPPRSLAQGDSFETFWSSCLSPVNPRTFAIGGSDAVSILSPSLSIWNVAHKLKGLGSEVLSVDFLSSDAGAGGSGQIIAIGHRDGDVRLWDVRTGGNTLRFVHNSSVRNVRRVDDSRGNQLIVNGLGQALRLYDVRMPTLRISSRSGLSARQRGKTTTETTGYTSMPVIEYDHETHVTGTGGLDLHCGLGLLGAVDASGTLKLFQLQTGEQIRSFDLGMDKMIGRPGCGCLKFIDDPEEGVMLAGGFKNEIHTFSW